MHGMVIVSKDFQDATVTLNRKRFDFQGFKLAENVSRSM